MEFLSRVKNSANIFSASQANPGTIKTKFDQEDYTKILDYFSSLRDLISVYISKYQNKSGNDDKKIIGQLNECKNRIPMIVVWGAQSSGKSAMLNKIFPELKLNLKSCNGLGTRCPVEIHAGPSYQTRIYVRSTKLNGLHFFESLSDAEEYIEKELSKESPDSICDNAKIILETKHIININIVDLPGVTNNKTFANEKFFETHKKEYLMKPETIILHVVNGTIDPKSDISAHYLEDVNSEMIKVLTHTDLWKVDHTRSEYLQKYDDDPRIFTIALVNSNKDEMEILNSIELKNLNKDLIIGSYKLTEIISNMHKQKIFNFMKDFLICIRKAQDIINTKLDVIGRQEPDMSKYAIEFKIFMLEEIKKGFHNGSNLAVELNLIKNDIAPEKLQVCFKLVPEPIIIAQDIENGNINQIKGTEGWNDPVQKYIAVLINKIKEEIIIKYINDFCEILKKNADNILQKEFKPCTIPASKKIISNMEDYHNNGIKDLSKKITEILDNIAIQAHGCDGLHDKQYLYSIYSDPFRLAFSFISNKSDSEIAKFIKAASNKNSNELSMVLDAVLKNNLDNIYLAKGNQAKLHLKYIWESKCIQINSAIIDILNSYIRSVEAEIKKEIQEIDHSHLKEPENINSQRNSLLGIYKTSDEIVSIIKKYI